MKKKTRQPARRLTHLNPRGEARMVDVSAKKVTSRQATASAELRLAPATVRMIRDGKLPKGDVLAVARIAGIQGAKRTPELIPLCHPIPIDGVDVRITFAGADRIQILSTVSVADRTGVEMEALTACSIAALALYDMCKAVDRGIVIGPIRLEAKSGGRSGAWRRGSP